MKDSEYKIQVDNLNQVINIALEVIKKDPPKGFDNNSINQFLNTYLNIKDAINNPNPEFKNKQSLKYYTNDVFIFFQESHGNAVNAFWNKIKENDLPFKRENKLLKILKRKKIKNKIEYDFLMDVLVPYKIEGLIDDVDMILINTLIKDYEKKQGDN